jgi:hypothetical protein
VVLGPHRRPAPGAPLFLLLAALVSCAGCAAPAPPKPPSLQVPDAVTDLRAHQSGTAVVLHFTLPRQSTDGATLAGPRRVQIFREFGAATAAPPPSGRPAYTLDAQQLSGGLAGDTVTFPDALTPEEFQARQGEKVSYRVRTAASKGGWSALSKVASVTLVAPPAGVRDLQATVSAGAVTLRWSTPASATPPAPGSFTIYRAPLDRQGNATGATESVGVTTGASYRDTLVESGNRYRYTVRAMSPAPGGEVESADSAPVIVTVPAPAVPPPPEGLAAIPVRRPSGSLEVDLSWTITGERNLAGYNVYRSERKGERGKRLNRQPLASAAFRDTTVAPGRTYDYSVTSVDLAGKESAPSAPVTVKVSAPGAGHD